MSRKKRLSSRAVKARAPAALALIFLAVFQAAMVFKDLPDSASLAGRVIRQSTKIYDRTGEILLYEIHGGERRTVIPFGEIPDFVKHATLAAEDANFYQHPAFDLRAIARALLHNLLSRSQSSQGGSTITQQLVKNSFLKPERTIRRKIRELILAIRLERIYSKDEIFGLYLNQIPYGSNAYGIEAAGQTFFAKPAADLTLAEAAVLASLPKAPSFYSPYGSHVEELRDRQVWILERMARLGFISEADLEKARETKLKFARQSYGIKAPHFVMYVREILAEKYGEEMVESGGLKVVTTLDWKLQEIAEIAVEAGALRNKTAWQASNAALAALDVKTSQILAMVGSRDYFELENSGNVNVTTRVRQPGSAFKPFAYLTAFRKGYTPETVIFDIPTEFSPRCSFEGKPPSNESEDICYHPINYDEKFRGPVTMRQALAQSLNVPSVQVLYLAGLRDTLETARAFGITTLKEPPGYYGLPLVLGGGGVKLLEMVSALAGFARDGVWQSPTPILKIEDSKGKIVEGFREESRQVFDARYVRILNDVLSDDAARVPAFQAGGPLTLPGRPVAAKTGTSQDYRDAWTIGYTPSLAAGVWVGNNDNTPMIKAAAGVMAAAPIWHEFMSKAVADQPPESFPKPEPTFASKPILKGEYIIPVNGMPEIHSTLFWIKKDDPHGPQPKNPNDDPQFANWEASLRKWLLENSAALVNPTLISPNLPANPPAPESQNYSLPEAPIITILEPKNQAKLGSREIRVTSQIQARSPLTEIIFFWNGEPIITLDPNPENIYSVYFVPANLKDSNEIKIQASDVASNISSATIIVYP